MIEEQMKMDKKKKESKETALIMKKVKGYEYKLE